MLCEMRLLNHMQLFKKEHFKIFQNDITKNKLNLTCSVGNTPSFQTPSPWPECVSYLNCTEPPIDPQVMVYDWTSSVGTSPNITVT